MKKEYRIKKNSDFQYAFKAGKSFANRQLVIYYVKREGQLHFRMGLSVGKKIGNAVTRNRIKRYLRQAFFELKDEIAYPYDIVIIARQPAKQMTFSEIKKSLTHLLYKEQLLKNQ
ncbi:MULTISPECIES: ribonuclease P protein component [Virgibacillus]|uniref:Ribonuclease P protein component n=1 Tax=Virgibacillus dokdonensis TaxID=302167 RepID=A0A2K9IYL9_9BACI|nr:MULTISPECIES: ribonuclease P protein component [Virgibacillus]AUJ24554.1 Ribonuclease P protein component [Virgibacillus dokdonensis]NWO14899.1 ribonuclease P protein component [Virgibacillus sp.]